MAKVITSRQALKAVERARTANERGFGRYRAYLAARDEVSRDHAAERVHHWLSREESQLAILEAFVRQHSSY